MSSSTAPSARPLTLTGYYSFILIGWNMVLIPAVIRSIEHDFRQTDAGLGLFFFLTAVIYGSGSLGGGFLVERVGRRRVLTGAACAFAAGMAGQALAPSWIGLIVAAVAVNVGAGSIDGGINGLFLDLHREARGGALNVLHLFFSVGALIAPFAIGLLVTAGVSWRVIMSALAVGAAALAVLLATGAMPSGRHQRQKSVMPADESFATSERSLLPFIGLAAAICLYVAGEGGVSAWLVKYLSGVSETTATGVLSIFWAGLALGRLLSKWVAERLDYVVFTAGCMVLASACLVAALFVPFFPLAAVLFGGTGLFYGPIYPMIMAIGGNIYPHRLARLSGSLGSAAVLGGVAYPPLIGLMATSIGIRAGLVGAALLGVPATLAILAAGATSRRAAGADREQAIAAS